MNLHGHGGRAVRVRGWSKGQRAVSRDARLQAEQRVVVIADDEVHNLNGFLVRASRDVRGPIGNRLCAGVFRHSLIRSLGEAGSLIARRDLHFDGPDIHRRARDTCESALIERHRLGHIAVPIEIQNVCRDVRRAARIECGTSGGQEVRLGGTTIVCERGLDHRVDVERSRSAVPDDVAVHPMRDSARRRGIPDQIVDGAVDGISIHDEDVIRRCAIVVAGDNRIHERLSVGSQHQTAADARAIHVTI